MTHTLQSISVFCGSSMGTDPKFLEAAMKTGTFLANQGIRIIYGGARVGLMGAVADSAIKSGGEVVGVIPEFLMSKEIAHNGLSKLITVKSMQERKTRMNDLSDAAIILPGGFGTLDEMFELLTWGQLGLHKKPVGLLNVNGFWDHLVSSIDKMVEFNLLRHSHRNMLIVGEDLSTLFDAMELYEAPNKAKWMEKDQV
ncbi:MAG: TIGR00730 family Rossman fold protein [Saprospiraceae bacterium]